MHARTAETEAKATLARATKLAQDDKNESLTLRSQKKLVKARIHKLNIELANKHKELEQMTERIVNLDKKIPENERDLIEAQENYESCHKQAEICEADRSLVEKVLKTNKTKLPIAST